MDDGQTSEPSSVEADFTSKPWAAYIEASLGLCNYWYPACFASEVPEDECLGVRLLGERILLKRVGGRVHAVEDRCVHRGVSLSARPECYSANTVTCWYHGFTYDVRDGKLVAIITDPESPLIGKAALKSYFVEERKNLVFVFIGDGEPTPLVESVQPGFLDDDLYIAPNGARGVVKCNWRLAAENGVDASHIYIHRNSKLLSAARRAVPLSSYFVSRDGMVVEIDGGPKGVVKGAGRKVSVWQTEVEGNTVATHYRPEDNPAGSAITDTSLWLPCGLKVDPFPTAGMIHFEWYVPIDETSHYYVVTWGKRVAGEAAQQQFAREVETHWKELVVDHFNHDDVFAREEMERFYAEEDGWNRERLFRPDVILTEWRKLASRCHRGIQRRQHPAPVR
ncbi:MAG: Rieske 2Fe-2S domain-containing protein [Alphaproteobacteria bacterium]